MEVRVVSGVDNLSCKDFDCVIVLTSSAEDIQGTPFDDDIKRLLQVSPPQIKFFLLWIPYNLCCRSIVMQRMECHFFLLMNQEFLEEDW